MEKFKESDSEDLLECPESKSILDEEEIKNGLAYYPTNSECFFHYTQGNCSASCEIKFITEITLNLLLGKIDHFNFKEFKTEFVQEKNGETITTIKSLKGIFTNESKVIAILHRTSNPDLLPNNFSNKLKDLIEIKEKFEGTNYLLVKANDNIFAFKKEHYRTVKDIILTIDFDFPFDIEKIEVSKNGEILCITVLEGTRFIISGLKNDHSYEVEERILLSKKVEEASPFFHFEPFKKVNWSKLKEPKGSTFENLCEILLQKNSKIVRVDSIGKPNASDRGRDFIAFEETFDLSGVKTTKWLVQCKYSTHSISSKTITGWIENVIEHNLDGFWLITNNDITPNLYDQLNDTEKNDKLKIVTKIWQRNNLDVLFNLQNEEFNQEYFEHSN